MKPEADSVEAIREALRRFVDERDWDQFHSPKNLAVALAVEAAELLEPFQWKTEEESASLAPQEREAIAEEVADVFLYLLRLSDKLGIDLLEASRRKLALNAAKYPVEKSRGRSTKYTEL